MPFLNGTPPPEKNPGFTPACTLLPDQAVYTLNCQTFLTLIQYLLSPQEDI